jgi:hypothetical protein
MDSDEDSMHASTMQDSNASEPENIRCDPAGSRSLKTENTTHRERERL